MNIKIYIATIFISIMLIASSLVYNTNFTTLLSSVGCSGFAAALMAIFLERSAIKREKKRQMNAKSLYFVDIYKQLTMLFERILWFDERMNDKEFNWDLPHSQYTSLKYMLAASSFYGNERNVTYKEALSLLNKVGEKYTLEKQSAMPAEELEKVQKMFLIIAYSCNSLMFELNSIRDNKLILHNENYITLEKTNNLVFSITLAMGTMITPNKNYSVAIKELISAANTIRNTGGYTGGIRIGLHGSIKTTEL